MSIAPCFGEHEHEYGRLTSDGSRHSPSPPLSTGSCSRVPETQEMSADEDVFSNVIAATTPYTLSPLATSHELEVPTHKLQMPRRVTKPGRLSGSPPKAPAAARTLRTNDGQLYHVTSLQLGKGSFGEVHLCLDMGKRQLLAAKHYLGTGSKDLAFVAEAEASNYQLGCSPWTPHAVLASPDRVDGYALMPLACGDLSGLLKDGGATDLRVRAGLSLLTARGVCTSLAKLHENERAHCDVKPDNILHRGLSIMLGDYEGIKPLDYGSYTTTLSFCPPETFRLASKAGLAKLDMWGLGATLLDIGGNRSHLLWNLSQEVGPGQFSKFKRVQQALVRERMVLTLQCMMAVQPYIFGERPALPVIPEPVGDYDPVKQIGAAPIAVIQRGILDATDALPPAVRRVTQRLLSPDPTNRPTSTQVLAMLEGPETSLDCYASHGAALLRRASMQRGEEIARALQKEVPLLDLDTLAA